MEANRKKELNSFDLWNINKKEINFTRKKLFPKHREVWYISLGKNIGFESNGKGNDFKRPVLVLKRIGAMFLVVSMTTRGKENGFYYRLDNKYFGKSSYVTLSQFKTIDKKRFIEKIGKLDNPEFTEIKNRVKNLF